jgi:hypothetical protein
MTIKYESVDDLRDLNRRVTGASVFVAITIRHLRRQQTSMASPITAILRGTISRGFRVFSVSGFSVFIQGTLMH